MWCCRLNATTKETGEELEQDLITPNPAAGKQLALQAAARHSAEGVQVFSALRVCGLVLRAEGDGACSVLLTY